MTGAPLPGQTDRATVAALQQQHRALDWRNDRVRVTPITASNIQTPPPAARRRRAASASTPLLHRRRW